MATKTGWAVFAPLARDAALAAGSRAVVTCDRDGEADDETSSRLGAEGTGEVGMGITFVVDATLPASGLASAEAGDSLTPGPSDPATDNEAGGGADDSSSGATAMD
ncbi:MAG: hypothetical protein K9J43_05975 [Polynucleobacter sp.]|nr:hypothetical protein [Polynucleobacter sp.]